MIRIRNKDFIKETFWQPMQFLDWVHRLRDYDIEDSIKELYTVSDETWEAYENTETFEDSLNNSRISINITPVKKHLNESLQQLTLDTSVLGNSFVNQTFDDFKEQETVSTCLAQIELATNTLRKLYDRNDGIQKVTESLNDMQNIIGRLRETLTIRSLCECTNESANYVQNCNSIVTEKSENTNLTLSEDCNTKFVTSPTKSTLRNNVRGIDKIIQKNVRFTDKLKKDVT